MSKKLIAVASATALALSALVGIAPAHATVGFEFNPSTGGSTTGTQDGLTAATANTVPVPSANVLAATQAAAVTVDTARIVRVTGVASGDTVTVATTGTVKVLESLVGYATASVNYNVANVGATSWTKSFSTAAGNVPAGGNLDLNFFTTSDVTGSAVITLTRTGLTSSKTYYFKGVAGAAHTVKGLTGVPTSLAKDATATFSFQVTDVFGNAVEAQQVTTSSFYTISPANATIAKATGTDGNGWDSSSKTYKMTLTGVNSDPYVFKMDLDFTAAAAGLAATADTSSAVINNPAVAAQVATLTAQIATMRPKATSVTKKRYNTLARKWNAAFPSQKVKLKK
jgi:hypothetical protein